MAKTTKADYEVTIGYMRFRGTVTQCQAIQKAIASLAQVDAKWIDSLSGDTRFYDVERKELDCNVRRARSTLVTKAEFEALELAATRKRNKPKLEDKRAVALIGYNPLPDGGGIR